MQRRSLLATLTLQLAASTAWPQSGWPPAASALRGAPGAAPQPKLIKWDALVAPGWDATAGIKGADLKNIDLASLSDADPRTAALYKRMREAWDQAPVNMAMIDQTVRIAGYVVPLEGDAQQGLREFLLVPSYGACIHTPAPPASQVIHVVLRSAAKGLRTMDTVWVAGALKYARSETGLAWSNWRMESVRIEPYEGGATAVIR